MKGRTKGLHFFDSFGNELMDLMAVESFASIFFCALTRSTNIFFLVSMKSLQMVPK